MRWLAAGTFAALVVIGPPARAEVVAAAALAQARRDGRADVVVALRAPAAGARVAEEQRAAVSRLRDAVLHGLEPGDATVAHAYTSVAGFAATVSAAGLERLARHPDVARVDLDVAGRAALDQSVPQIQVDRVHARGVAGDGTVVAVIDVGVDADHPDLADALIQEECFCRGGAIGGGVSRRPCCPGRRARASGPGSAATAQPHGSHVAGIALSRGRLAPVGVAPAARLVAVRVLDENTVGFLSDWIAALDWVATERPDVRVVNMSLVSDLLFVDGCERECQGDGCAENMLFAEVIDDLARRGAVVFAAAGNDGARQALASPACVSRAVSVGAVSVADQVASFSNTTPGLDLLAPGVDVVSDGAAGDLKIMKGTSMAAPHAAGTAALLISAHPSFTTDQLVALLRTTGVPVVDRRTGRVTPRVDAFAALRETMRNLDFERGGGSRATDCLLEWNFIPPALVRHAPRPVATCRDNDPLCDADDREGQCTFLLSLCFNVQDPLLRQCRVDEPVLAVAVESPSADAPPGTLERANAERLAAALPAFPVDTSTVCSAAFSFVVPRRRADRPGVDRIRTNVRTATRRDYDHVVLQCAHPLPLPLPLPLP